MLKTDNNLQFFLQILILTVCANAHCSAFHMLRGLIFWHMCSSPPIRALSAQSAAEFNISPGRWQHLWLMAIVPPKRWGKMDRNDCHTAWGNFKTLISSLYHYKNYAWFFSLFGFFKK
jgi:hypothetical protein